MKMYAVNSYILETSLSVLHNYVGSSNKVSFKSLRS